MKDNAIVILEFVGSRSVGAADSITVAVGDGKGMDALRKTGEVATDFNGRLSSAWCSVGIPRVNGSRVGVGHLPCCFLGVVVGGKLERDGLAFAAGGSTGGFAAALGVGAGPSPFLAGAIGAAVFYAVAVQTVAALGVVRTSQY